MVPRQTEEENQDRILCLAGSLCWTQAWTQLSFFYTLTFLMNVQHDLYKKGLKGFVSMDHVISILLYYALEIIGFITF